MIDHFESKPGYSIRFSCPTRRHVIEISCEPETVVTVPRECPTCGIGLPDAYRIKLREILNVARFDLPETGGTYNDIEIDIA